MTYFETKSGELHHFPICYSSISIIFTLISIFKLFDELRFGHLLKFLEEYIIVTQYDRLMTGLDQI